MEFGLKNIIFILVFLAGAAFFSKNVLKLISYLKLARPDNRFGEVGKRIVNTLIVAIGQKKILRDKKAGPIHAAIFWGFLILLFSALNSIFSGFGIDGVFGYLGPIFSLITILTDFFILFIIVAVLMALLRRLIIKVPRLQRKGHNQAEASLILVIIFFIVTSLIFENASAIALNHDTNWAIRPLAHAVSPLISLTFAPTLYEICWWVHIVLILVFMNFLPYSKHLHVLSSVPNVFFSNITPTNRLKTIDFEDENITQYGAADFEDFSWKTIHDSYTCTECGRCSSVCPATQTGKILDPREIILQIRHRTMDKAPIAVKMKKEDELAAKENREPNYNLTENEQAILDKKLIGDYINPEALWQCTTCSACMQECPVNIEHVPAILDMRRNMVLMEAEFPAELGTPFTNIENNSAPWAFPLDARADWAEGTGIQEVAEKQDFDVLFWVGCAGSFDDRAKNITLSFAKLMQIADVNFAILGREENCCGDPARRAGNEYLADMYVKINIETLNNYNIKDIVATCPHCFNTIKNEYPDLGGKYNIHHHTEYLQMLLDKGKLKTNDETKEALSVTFHDSCYTGRLNNIYDEPRKTLLSVPGLQLLEPKRNRDKGFCCGAGGAQIFMEENRGKRINIERTEELLETGSKTIALNCPFCLTMINDGVKALESEVQVKDISEILLENIKN